MVRIPPQDFEDDGDVNGAEKFRPLTAEEAQKLRLQQPLLSIWRVVLAQFVVGLAVAALDLSWPAMLVGLVVTMKVYWVVFAWRKVFHPET